eukprot:COSAG04_NODE_20289_length_397_cov_0.449664_1_plen_99_part_10
MLHLRCVPSPLRSPAPLTPAVRSRENALFASYLERVAPPSGAEEEEAAPAPTKKGKGAKSALPTEVSLEQKTELAQQEVDDLRDEIELTKASSEKLLDR